MDLNFEDKKFILSGIKNEDIKTIVAWRDGVSGYFIWIKRLSSEEIDMLLEQEVEVPYVYDEKTNGVRPCLKLRAYSRPTRPNYPEIVHIDGDTDNLTVEFHAFKYDDNKPALPVIDKMNWQVGKQGKFKDRFKKGESNE